MNQKKMKIVLWAIVAVLCFQAAGPAVVSAENLSDKDSRQQWWWNKDKNNPEERQNELPDPEGGPELTERPRNPVSNIVLQQRYPEIVVLRGPETENKVALTFDDGPDPRFTPQILDVLSEYGVQATFFVMGARAEANPELTRRIIDEGHIVGNHTYFHPNLVEEGDVATLRTEVSRTEDALADIIGYRTKLFRAPYGFLYNELVEALGEMDYTVVGWSVDSLDWRERPAEETAYNVISNSGQGSVILMHDGAESDGDRTGTVEALRQIIPALQEQGLEFVTIPELFGIPFRK
ncbi:polysaccharide deacetylase family protein [Evansella sp. LMS18]|uniref:polysaccharide deacetylase family protein n=1 Tax=Evansella sp. LMS18 TaxID=2924033 RepID=UPI0020D175BD|nr:polysaccharide deacetylase family protein [Evansella sp. LMS18]UTR10694.1 polysaccharide deacetylase family protein [Evansella sp. LMS18]